MKKFVGLMGLTGFASVASAQAPTGTYTWQVSGNDGTSWETNLPATPGTTVKVRLLASWSGIADALGVGFAGGQFDATLMGADPIDTVSAITRPGGFGFFPQNLVASNISGGKKIDTNADFNAPGAGVGWVQPGQASYVTNPSGFNSANGAVIFSYDVLFSGTYDIAIGMVLNQSTGRAMTIFTNAQGTSVRIDDSAITVNSARIVIPGPSSFALLGLGALAASCRRISNNTSVRIQQ